MTEDEYKALLAGEGSTPPSVGKHFGSHVRNNPKYKVTPLGAEPKQPDSDDDDAKLAVA
jgi:hypothetical protein